MPWYVGSPFDDAPPGHRYLMYLPFWRGDWSTIKEGKQRVLRSLCHVPEHSTEAMSELARRQRAIGERLGAAVIEAKSTSPLTTGLGWEHPNENGFAFLQPYGLPYLAGSGVKGVLRRAAQELAGRTGEETHGWNKSAVVALFGLEPKPGSEESSRGALRFLDVIPELPASGLEVDIMNPHYGDYYQGISTPHDAGSPVPIFFLVVPQGSRFTFVVDCPYQHRLAEDLRSKWRDMISEAFMHAFDWLGFGAKTAVGYGALALLPREEVSSLRAQSKARALRCDWVDATLRELAAKNRSSEAETLRGRALAEAWANIPDESLKARALDDIRARWKAQGWWDAPPGGAARKARVIYDGGQ